MMDRSGGSEHCRLSRRKGQTNERRARNFERSLGVGCDLDDAALPRKRGGYVKVAVDIKRQALRASQTAVKSRNAAMRVDLVHGIETRSRGTRDKQVSARPECQMVSGYAGFERGENKNLAIFADLENCPAAIADIKIFVGIKRDPGRNPHALPLRS